MNNSEEDLERLCEFADNAWQNYQIPELKADTWGVFSYGDAPAGIGGGAGCFLWFTTKADMLQFVGDVFPYSPPGPLGSDVQAVANEVDQICQQILANQISMEVGRASLNQTLRHFSQVEWWGTFAELCVGNHPYAQKVIQNYRDSPEVKNGCFQTPIQDTELELFKAFLEDFGA